MSISVTTIASDQYAFAETQTYVISSGSMSPALELNDVVVVDTDYPFQSLQVGDIIVFNRPDGGDRVIIHRIIDIDEDADGDITIRTKGDANPSPIPGTDYPITRELYIGKVVNVIPGIGVITKVISPPVNYIIIAIVYGIIIYRLYNRWKNQKMVSLSRDTVLQPTEVYNQAYKIIGSSKLRIKNTVLNQIITAEAGRDFKWSWMIVSILFAWPAAIAYYLSSKKNSMNLSIVPKGDGSGSTIIVQATGRAAEPVYHQLSAEIR